MRAVRTALLAVLILTGLCAPGARADGYLGQRDAPELLVPVTTAVDLWGQRGVTGCPQGVHAYMADDLTGADIGETNGRGGDCKVWVLSSWWPTATPQAQCSLMAHEVGHALGLNHEAPWDVMRITYEPACQPAYAPPSTTKPGTNRHTGSGSLHPRRARAARRHRRHRRR